MSKVSSVLEKIQKLYAKDASINRILSNSEVVTKEYKIEDGVPLDTNNPIRLMSNLPCLPFNKIIQIAGRPDAGKSTIAAQTIVSAQKAGLDVIIWDAEDKFDAVRFKNELGGDDKKLYLLKTNEIRKGGQLIKDYIDAIKEENKEAKILVVWDSVGASVSRSETERNLADERHGQPGQDAKENGSVIKHWVGMFNRYPDSLSVLLINQTYAKIGFMQKGDQAKGGTGIEYFSSLIMGLKRVKVLTKTEKKKKVKVGIVSRATITKNHLTQSKTSIYQQDFIITASGVNESDLDIGDEEDEGD